MCGVPLSVWHLVLHAAHAFRIDLRLWGWMQAFFLQDLDPRMERAGTRSASSATLVRAMDLAQERSTNMKVEPDDEEEAMQREMQARVHVTNVDHLIYYLIFIIEHLDTIILSLSHVYLFIQSNISVACLGIVVILSTHACIPK